MDPKSFQTFGDLIKNIQKTFERPSLEWIEQMERQGLQAIEARDISALDITLYGWTMPS